MRPPTSSRFLPSWNRYWRPRCPNYRCVDFLTFDIRRDHTEKHNSTVLADQVLQHVQRPPAVVQGVHAMDPAPQLGDGGGIRSCSGSMRGRTRHRLDRR